MVNDYIGPKNHWFQLKPKINLYVVSKTKMIVSVPSQWYSELSPFSHNPFDNDAILIDIVVFQICI